MKIEELQSLNAEELTQKLAGFKRQMFDLRMQAAVGKLDKPHQMGLVRRDVARVMTVLRDRRRQQPEGPGGSKSGG